MLKPINPRLNNKIQRCRTLKTPLLSRKGFFFWASMWNFSHDVEKDEDKQFISNRGDYREIDS